MKQPEFYIEEFSSSVELDKIRSLDQVVDQVNSKGKKETLTRRLKLTNNEILESINGILPEFKLHWNQVEWDRNAMTKYLESFETDKNSLVVVRDFSMNMTLEANQESQGNFMSASSRVIHVSVCHYMKHKVYIYHICDSGTVGHPPELHFGFNLVVYLFKCKFICITFQNKIKYNPPPIWHRLGS